MSATGNAAAFATAMQTAMRHHQSGALIEAEALYRQALALDPGNPDALHFLGIACSQQGRYDEAIRLIEQALALSPAVAAMQINLGNALLGAGRNEEAVTSYGKAIALEPGNANAHRNLGSALNALWRHEEAAASYRTALELKPGYAEAHNNLGITLMELERYEEAMVCLERARTLRPDYAEAHNQLGGALKAVNRYQEALVCIERALTLQPDSADAHWYRAMARLALGDYEGGWADYEWRRRLERVSSHPLEFPQPLWLGEGSLAGRTILLHCEQGFGDTLQFVRYAPLVARRGARVLLLVQPPLQRLLTGMEGVAAVYGANDVLPGFDCHCPLMSLPHAFGTKLETIPAATPYLHADPVAVQRWRERLGNGAPKIGLVWAGASRDHEPRSQRVDRRRSLALALLAPLAGVPGVRFVSLQKGPPALQVREPPRGMALADFTDELYDFADTAALVAALDLVITVDTSVAHLAGGMGRPVWILSRFDACWRWLIDREDSPWYPTARIYRQPVAGDWDSVIARVTQELADWSARA